MLMHLSCAEDNSTDKETGTDTGIYQSAESDAGFELKLEPVDTSLYDNLGVHFVGFGQGIVNELPYTPLFDFFDGEDGEDGTVYQGKGMAGGEFTFTPSIPDTYVKENPVDVYLIETIADYNKSRMLSCDIIGNVDTPYLLNINTSHNYEISKYLKDGEGSVIVCAAIDIPIGTFRFQPGNLSTEGLALIQTNLSQFLEMCGKGVRTEAVLAFKANYYYEYALDSLSEHEKQEIANAALREIRECFGVNHSEALTSGQKELLRKSTKSDVNSSYFTLPTISGNDDFAAFMDEVNKWIGVPNNILKLYPVALTLSPHSAFKNIPEQYQTALETELQHEIWLAEWLDLKEFYETFQNDLTDDYSGPPIEATLQKIDGEIDKFFNAESDMRQPAAADFIAAEALFAE